MRLQLSHQTLFGFVLSATLAAGAGQTAELFVASAKPLTYTNFADLALTEQARHFAQIYSGDLETHDQQSHAFEGHIQINQTTPKKLVHELSIFWSPRVCAPLRTTNGVAVSRCPARLITYTDRGPDLHNIDDVCIVSFNDAPPPPHMAGWTGAHVAAKRDGDDVTLIVSALLQGAVVSECAKSIPLRPRGD